MSTLVFTLLTTALVFLIYAMILIKFYKRKRNYENIREESLKDSYMEVSPIKFSGTFLFIIPVRLPMPIPPLNSGVILREMSEGNARRTETSEPDKKAMRRSTMSRRFSFHLSYLKSSNYVLVILLSFCIFHAPLFFYQARELVRYGSNS